MAPHALGPALLRSLVATLLVRAAHGAASAGGVTANAEEDGYCGAEDGLSRCLGGGGRVGDALLQHGRRLGQAPPPARVEAEADVPSMDKTETLDNDVIIVTYADEKFAQIYATNLRLLSCYAGRHNYSFEILLPNHCTKIAPTCDGLHEVFFKKQCCVAGYLETLRAAGRESHVFVLDADVTVAVPGRGLESWRSFSDLVFYEREFGGEIAAGNYVARPTAYAIRFLQNWSNWEHNRPVGFSSGDNGPLHLMLQDAFNKGDAKIHTPHYSYSKCAYTFSHLTADVTNLTQYYDFISCTRQSISTPRQVHAPGGSSITVLPRYFAWVTDWTVANGKACERLGPVLHHGIKSQEAQAAYAAGAPPGAASCRQSPGRLVPEDQYKKMVESSERFAEEQWSKSPWKHVRHEALTRCIPDWSCADWA